MDKISFVENTQWFHQALGISDARVEEIKDGIEPALEALDGAMVSDAQVLALSLAAGDPQNLAEHTFIVFVIAQFLLRHDRQDEDILGDIF